MRITKGSQARLRARYWYGPLRRGRVYGWLLALSGVVVTGLALAGYTYDMVDGARRHVVVNGVAGQVMVWGPMQWPALVLGVLLVGIGVYKARHGDECD